MYDKIYRKDHDIQQASERCKTRHYWYIDNGVDCSDFDFNWTPVPWESRFTHVFHSAWQRDGGIRLVNKDYPDGDVKFNNEKQVSRVPIEDKWVLDPDTDYINFDFSWHPDTFAGVYTYVFPSQWQRDGGTRYVIEPNAPIKYVSDQITIRIPNEDNWLLDSNTDYTNFDFSWHCDQSQEEFVYVFPSQWQRDGGTRYITNPNAPVKYISDQITIRIPNEDNWLLDSNTDYTNFDFSWHPNTFAGVYTYVFPSQWQRDGGTRYVIDPIASIKYVSDQVTTRAPNEDNWLLDPNTDYSDFDFSWHPDDSQGEFTYVFPSQWQRDGGTRYITNPNAPIKYVSDQVTKRTPSKANWMLNDHTDYTNFDFSWHPDLSQGEYAYIFPSQWQRDGGTKYVLGRFPFPKYVSDQVTKRTNDLRYWKLPDNIDTDAFDFSWHPDPAHGSWTYVFPSLWQRNSNVTYSIMPDAPTKYVSDQVIRPLPKKEDWIIPDNIDEDSFDFSWMPDPDVPPYIYIFGTQWQKDGGPIYKVEGATKIFYCTNPLAKAIPNMRNWHIEPTGTDYSSFDFSWHPEEAQKDYKHIFGTQWQRTSPIHYYSGPANESNPKINYVSDQRITTKSNVLPRYTIKTTLEDLIDAHPDERFWALNAQMNYDKFDFSWHPDLSQMDYVHVFGSQWQKHSQTYYVNAPAYLEGNTNLNFTGDQKVVANSTLDIFYMDRGGEGNTERYNSLALKHSQTLKTRYFGNTLDTLLRCAKKSKTERFWAVSSENSYSDFNFDWHCEPWQKSMLHVFGSKWNKWSSTFLVNADDFIRTYSWVDKIEDVYNLNFVEDQLVTTLDDLNDIIFLDFGNKSAEEAYNTVYSKHPRVKRIRFFDNYLDTFKRIIVKVETDYFWVTSSICDYSQFDFSWQPEPWQDTMLHTFQSGEQKFGDTFYVNKAHAVDQLKNIKLLDWYDKVNYCDEQIVTRTEWPEVVYDTDLVTAIKEHTFESPYVAFKHRSMAEYKTNYDPSVWRSEDRSLHVLSQSGSVSVVPKDCKEQISRQVYDYPYIMRHEGTYMPDKPQDIVFLSYDEKNAQENYEVLLKSFPYAKRVHGVEGIMNAKRKAAEICNTPYFYIVFAKTVIHEDFKFDYQPDWLSNPKNYIFHAYNPVLDYSYGHGSITLFDTNWIATVKDEDLGLDIITSHEHEVIPVVSCVNVFDSPFGAWRTAFREVYKLCASDTVEDKYRLKLWTTKDNTEFGEYSKQGALRGVEQYNKIQDDFNINDWKWLRKQFDLWYSQPE